MASRSDDFDCVPDLDWFSDDEVVEEEDLLCDDSSEDGLFDDDQIGLLIDDRHAYDDTASVVASDSLTPIDCLEELALSFLSQLTFSLPDPSPDFLDTDDDIQRPEGVKTSKKGIFFTLANRHKPQPADSESMPTRRISFPRKTATGRASGASQLATLFRVVDLTHEALVHDIPVTKRDIFYKDVPLFKKQYIVDHLVDDLAATFGLSRSDLNVRASSKGLCCGSSITLRLWQGDLIPGNEYEATLIPPGESIAEIQVKDDLGWVLVVEKEAVFQTLCRHGLTRHPSMPPGLLITGKGYPDMATRELVSKLSNGLPPSIPVMALVDADPFGIDILSVYKFGSHSMRHEADKLVSPRIEWIGVFGTELASLGVESSGLIPISARDHKKAHSMLSRLAHAPPEFRRELTHMLHTRHKAEIQIVSDSRFPTAHADVRRPVHWSTQSPNSSLMLSSPLLAPDSPGILSLASGGDDDRHDMILDDGSCGASSFGVFDDDRLSWTAEIEALTFAHADSSIPMTSEEENNFPTVEGDDLLPPMILTECEDVDGDSSALRHATGPPMGRRDPPLIQYLISKILARV